MPLPDSTWSIEIENAVSQPAVPGGTIGGIVEPVEVLGRGRHAHQTPRPAQHEVDRLGGHPLRGHREVALVLAVLVVGDEDHLAPADPTQCLVDARELHVVISSGSGTVVARGRVTTMRHPCGSRGSGWISPPWRSTIHRAMARPSPAPPSEDARAESAR